MSDVFDIGGSAYSNQRKNNDNYIHRHGRNEWLPAEALKDPRLSRRDKEANRYSPSESPHFRGQHSNSPQRDARWRSPETAPQIYNQHSHSQQQYSSQIPPPPPVYSEYNTVYGASATQYQHGYQQSFQPNSNNFSQYSQQRGYPAQAQSSSQGYNSSHQQQQQQQQQHQPGPPGDDYPSTSWAPVVQHRQQQLATYTQMNHQQPPPVPRPPSVTSTIQSDTVKSDEFKKEAGIANELKQQRATLIKQRDDYLRKSSVLRRELDKLRIQKQELFTEKSPPRESQRILRENAKLQVEIQNKLKSIYNVIDMLSGIIGDGLKAVDFENKIVCSESSPKQPQRSRKSTSRQLEHDSDSGSNNGVGSQQSIRPKTISIPTEKDEDQPRYNYIHYDPELHWCRVCDVFPRTAKDLLTHLHSNEHRQVTQDHQLVDTPWHKLPVDPELPTYKGAPAKRIPIKGLQFFISATSWYCKLCDIWIGDLHCASLHLKSKNHAHNYSNFVEQNPHWETNWLKDREKAYARCAKVKQEVSNVPFTQEVPSANEKCNKAKKSKSKGDFLDTGKEKKRKKKTKKRKKVESSGSSSSSSTSSGSSTEDEGDKAKSIRVAMRNKMRMQAQMILNEELGNKVEVLEKLLGERNRKKDDVKLSPPPPPPPPDALVEDNIINQWMTVNPTQDKHIFDHLKDRLKQRQKADEEKVMEAAVEQRRRDREREERELKELREREQKEIQERIREKEQEEQKIKEREREKFRRKRAESRSPDYYNNRRSRSRESSRSRRNYSGHSNERYSGDSPNEKFKPKSRDYDEEESQFDKRYLESFKFKQNKNQQHNSSSKKLPFIGRMPLFKKKPESGGSSISEHSKSNSKKMKQDYQVRLSKFESGITARPFIPEPGVVHITKLATPQDTSHTMRINAENPPPPPKIIPEPPQISEMAPSPPRINTIVTVVEETDVQDMELDDAVALPPGVPVAEAKPIARPAGNHLPRDFQDALNIIFPGDQRPDLAAQNDPNLLLQYQYGMQYNMMYSNMQMQYDYNQDNEPEEETELVKVEDVVPPPPPDLDDKEDLAMLGIDAEDMAAQNF